MDVGACGRDAVDDSLPFLRASMVICEKFGLEKRKQVGVSTTCLSEQELSGFTCRHPRSAFAYRSICRIDASAQQRCRGVNGDRVYLRCRRCCSRSLGDFGYIGLGTGRVVLVAKMVEGAMQMSASGSRIFLPSTRISRITFACCSRLQRCLFTALIINEAVPPSPSSYRAPKYGKLMLQPA